MPANSPVFDLDAGAGVTDGIPPPRSAVIGACGGTLQDLVKVTFFVRDKADYRARARAIGEVYRELLAGHYPATTLVEVSALWDDDALIEIDGIAVLD